MKSIITFIAVFLAIIPCFAQDMVYARKTIDTLTSSYFWGRGYTKDGMKKASEYIAAQFNSSGVLPIKDKSFLQSFSYPVNTFPGKMDIAINGNLLKPGIDFIVSPASKSVKANGRLVQQDSVTFILAGDRVIVTLQDKLTWSVAGEVADYTQVFVAKKALMEMPSSIQLQVDNKRIKNFEAANVCGLVKGTYKPDTIIVFSAHYDHLGGMGDSTFFPGANDNASGIAMLLSLAKHYATNPPPYSVAFIAFAGEEAGLLGSKYFVEHPQIKLSTIRFLINIDLVGTGEEGITVVNASEFTNEFQTLNKINDAQQLLTKINSRGKAANSDHYWFTEKGVPAFFIYTLGGIKAYHDVDDKAATLPLTEFKDLFKLITNYSDCLMRSSKKA